MRWTTDPTLQAPKFSYAWLISAIKDLDAISMTKRFFIIFFFNNWWWSFVFARQGLI